VIHPIAPRFSGRDIRAFRKDRSLKGTPAEERIGDAPAWQTDPNDSGKIEWWNIASADNNNSIPHAAVTRQT
jgi:hypothetical protein